MYHAWLFDFLDGLGGGNDPLNFQNRAIGGFWEIARFIRRNGRKTTFEWPKVVSEVIFHRFWGVVCIEKCFRNFEILIGSAVSEISRFAGFYVFWMCWIHIRNFFDRYHKIWIFFIFNFFKFLPIYCLWWFLQWFSMITKHWSNYP